MSAAAAVQIDGPSYRFGDHLAIDDLDLSVSPGESFGLLGPNGAGKTATLRVLNTLYRPQSGTFAAICGAASLLGRRAR
jgi:ABC-2 type transport system ATP-binding protein